MSMDSFLGVKYHLLLDENHVLWKWIEMLFFKMNRHNYVDWFGK
jgi:hypothetical protein